MTVAENRCPVDQARLTAQVSVAEPRPLEI
jgi:hypothetical protein